MPEVETRRRTMAPLCIGIVLLLTGGCGNSDRPPMGRVWGKVTYKGEALTRGEVVFTPDFSSSRNTGQPAIGEIASDGSYELSTFDPRDGALVGSHIVTVKSTIAFTQAKPPNSEAIKKKLEDGSWGYVGLKSLIPKKYGTPGNSPLRSTVKEGTNEYNIELVD